MDLLRRDAVAFEYLYVQVSIADADKTNSIVYNESFFKIC